MSFSARLYPSYFASWIWKKTVCSSRTNCINAAKKGAPTQSNSCDLEIWHGIGGNQNTSAGESWHIQISTLQRRSQQRRLLIVSCSLNIWSAPHLNLRTELTMCPQLTLRGGPALEAETQRIKTKSFSKFFKSSAGPDSKCHSEVVDPKANGI